MKMLLLCSILLGCNTTTTTQYSGPIYTGPAPCEASEIPSVSPEIQSWVQDFYSLARKHEVTCYRVHSIKVVPQKEITQDTKDAHASVVGYCTSTGHIKLSEAVIKSYGLLFSKQLVFHELGHCALHLDHAPEGTVNLMSPYLLSEEVLEENWALLQEKLFNRSLSLREECPNVVFDGPFMPLLR